MIVFPRSRSSSRIRISLAVSRLCKPIDGSSRTYVGSNQPRSKARRKLYTLRLAARQCRRKTIERQILQSNVVQKLKALADLD